ncbi:CRISPR-associated endoribonuclease Cas6 [Litoribacter populi]|uniref:CRISPR-associated endoribonuclease Cas6 n=1 Tax=Litoribacter populi TaxID=2598460 RepID=UPI00117CF0B1|nr:CRISPR-associated endoribonuclease Cas6 [Litoribacter populi]
MRFRIHLRKEGEKAFLPINYQYELSSAIYKTIDRADSAFSRFLHEQGYLAFGRNFRLFTFSRLSFDGFKIIREAGRIQHHGEGACFEISFMVDRAAEEFVKGLFMDQVFVLGDKISQVFYAVENIVAMEPPVFEESMRYRCLSPIFIRRKRNSGGEDYLHPSDRDYGILLIQNLMVKGRAFKSSVGEGLEDESAAVPDFSFAPKGKVYKNGIRIKQLTRQETHLIGYNYEFEFRAPVELQEIGYYAGFGHLGSQGFGCVEIKKEKL